VGAEDDGAVPYQIPPVVYVGDRCRLIYPLDPFFFNLENSIIPLENIPKQDDVVIERLELQNGRLIVDFQGWRTGIIELPVITIDGREITGIEVRVASLLEGKDDAVILAPAKTPVNPPGALLMIAGFSLGIVLVIAVSLAIAFRGGSAVSSFLRMRRKRRAARVARNAVRRIKNHLENGHKTNAEAVGDVSVELRNFLYSFYGLDCRSLVPAEFLGVDFEKEPMPDQTYTSRYFAEFFTRCDTMRFSGKNISKEQVRAVIVEVDRFIAASPVKGV
jgi:hypothetical protein